MEEKLECSTDNCKEVPFICLYMEHYNEIIQKNIQEEKQHEDHILEPIA